MALLHLTDEQVQTWSREQKDRWWLENVYKADMAQLTYPFVPTAILRYPLATCEAAPAIGGPLLLIHGDRDQFIPPAQSERIRERAPASDLVFIAGAGHDDVHLFDAYLALLRRRLAAL